MKKAIIAIMLLLLCAAGAQAATITASSCSHADVQAAINSAVSGDVVIIPAGSCTWTSPYTWKASRIDIDLGDNYSGWTGQFACKVKTGDTEYVIEPKAITWVDESIGTAYVDLTATETATIGRYIAEIELSKEDQRLTAMRFILKVLDDVIKDAIP